MQTKFYVAKYSSLPNPCRKLSLEIKMRLENTNTKQIQIEISHLQYADDNHFLQRWFATVNKCENGIQVFPTYIRVEN